MFIAALFTRAKIWKQPKCLSTDECIKKMWYIYVYTHTHTHTHTHLHTYNGILLGHKKELSNSICRNMDITEDYHTKWSKSERERQIPYDITYM